MIARADNPRVLVVSFTPLHNDPRVRRQLFALRDSGVDVTAYGLSNPQIERVGYAGAIQKPPPKYLHRLLQIGVKGLLALLRQHEMFYWRRPHIQQALKTLGEQKYDVVIANDLDSLPLVLRLFPESRVLFDAHEYAPLEFEERWYWKSLVQPYREYLLKTYADDAEQMFTVCDGIAEKYRQQFGLAPTVITNAAPYRDLPIRQVDGEHIRMIYQGMCVPERCLEDVLKVMNYLDERFWLDLILIPGDRRYIDKIHTLVDRHPRIQIVPAVDVSEIPQYCNQYDIGFFPLKAKNFNYRHALPNKFFEFIQARLAVVTSPLPEMQRILERYGCGITAPDFSVEGMVEVLKKLSKQDIERMKQHADKAAKELHADEEMRKLLKGVKGDST